MATTMTEVLPATASSKNNAVRWTPNADDAFSPVAGVLAIDTKRASVSYTVSEFPADMPGRAFLLRKAVTTGDELTDSYTVFCSARGPHADSCDCPGHSYGRGRACKHTSAVRALIANAWL